MELHELNNELAEIFSSIEFEEDGGIQLTGVTNNTNSLKIEFLVRTGTTGNNQLWEIDIRNVRDELIKLDWADEIKILDDHPLLWRFTEKSTELYFSQTTNKPFEFINSILEIHYNILGNWYNWNQFINCGKNLSFLELCTSSSALFAKGPKKILIEYAKILDGYKMNPKFFGEWEPTIWTGKQWIDETASLSLLLMGNSYVIGETFEFNRK